MPCIPSTGLVLWLAKLLRRLSRCSTMVDGPCGRLPTGMECSLDRKASHRRRNLERTGLQRAERISSPFLTPLSSAAAIIPSHRTQLYPFQTPVLRNWSPLRLRGFSSAQTESLSPNGVLIGIDGGIRGNTACREATEMRLRFANDRGGSAVGHEVSRRQGHTTAFSRL